MWYHVIMGSRLYHILIILLYSHYNILIIFLLYLVDTIDISHLMFHCSMWISDIDPALFRPNWPSTRSFSASAPMTWRRPPMASVETTLGVSWQITRRLRGEVMVNFQWVFDLWGSKKVEVYIVGLRCLQCLEGSLPCRFDWLSSQGLASAWSLHACYILLYSVHSKSFLIIPIHFAFQILEKPFSFKVSWDIGDIGDHMNHMSLMYLIGLFKWRLGFFSACARPKASWGVIPSWHWTKMAWANSSNWPWPVATARGRTWRWASVGNMVGIRPPLTSARGDAKNCWKSESKMWEMKWNDVKCATEKTILLRALLLVGLPERVVHWKFIGTVSS